MVNGQGAVTGAAGGASVGTAISPGIGTAIGAGVGAVAGLFGGGGGSSQSSGYTIPPEMELQLVNYFQTAMTQLSADHKNITALGDAFAAKLDTLSKAMTGSIPSDQAVQTLAAHNMQIATNLGMSADDLISHGFMTAGDAEQIQKLKDLQTEDYSSIDPAFTQKLADGRAQLDQELRRQGASPATRAQALAQFDRDAAAQKFSHGQELKTTQAGLIAGTLQAGQASRAMGFQEVVNSLAAGQGEINMARQGYSSLTSMAQTELAGGLTVTKAGQDTTKAGMDLYSNLGQFKLSNDTKNLMESGLIGPGSVFSQTGVSRINADNYKNYITKQENAGHAGNGSSPASLAEFYAAAQPGKNAVQAELARNPNAVKDYLGGGLV